MNDGNPIGHPPLDARLAALPHELPPARDLWPGIEAAIAAEARPQRRRWPAGVAAASAVAVIAALIGWQAGRRAAVVADLAEARREAGFAVPAGSNYLATRAELERSYQERLALLTPTTRARIETDLAVVRAANADIRRALAADPASTVLNRLLESTWQQEFELYTTVTRATDAAAMRTRT